MSKIRLFWIFVLISIIALPIAHAQNLTATSQIILVLINAAIVGTVLFVLQSFLITGKEGKEKPAVYVAIVVGSLLIAFMYGRTSFIWQGPLATFFSMYVIVNATVIGTVLYILFGFLPGIKDKLGKEGSIGFGIIIFLISLFFAVKLGNQWIWDQNSIRQLIAYLFGADGILNPDPPAYRLYTFLGSFFLFSFFFRNYLIKDAGGPAWVNYGLAFLIASSVARSGYSLQSVIIMGELIFFLVLAQALKTNNEKFNWLISFILVGWASAAATYGTEYQGLFATLAGWPLVKLGLIAAPAAGAAAPSGWGWWLLALVGLLIFALPVGASAAVGGKWGMLAALGVLALLVFLLPGIGLTFFIIAGLIVAALVWAMKRAGVRNQLLNERIVPYLWNRFARSLSEGVLSKVPLLNKWKAKYMGYGDKLPQTLLDNRVLMQAMTNYCLRLDIFHAKNFYFDKACDSIAGYQRSMAQHRDLQTVKRDLVEYRSNVPSGTNSRLGWCYFNRLVIDELNKVFWIGLKWRLEMSIAKSQGLNVEDGVMNRYANEMNARIEYIHRLNGNRIASMKAYNSRKRAYAAHMGARSVLLRLLDMYNLSGNLEHAFLFARQGAEYIDRDGTVKTVTQKDTVEVDIFGYFVDDWNELKKEMRDTAGRVISDDAEKYRALPARKLKSPMGNIIPHSNLEYYREMMKPDWIYFNEDLRFGRFHPNSRTINDYSAAHAGDKSTYNTRTTNDDSILKTHSVPSETDPGFDRRAYADWGKTVYWGRKNFTDKTHEELLRTTLGGVTFLNPFPSLSTVGMALYLNEILKFEHDEEKAREFLAGQPADVGGALTRKEKVARTFAQIKEEAKK